MNVKTREDRVRRALRRQGLLVHKDRARFQTADHHGGYMVVDPTVSARFEYIAGGERYDLTLEDLERWAADESTDDEGHLYAHVEVKWCEVSELATALEGTGWKLIGSPGPGDYKITRQ